MAKRYRRDELESKLVEFEVEREIQLANREKAMGGSKREVAPPTSETMGAGGDSREIQEQEYQ